jgi:hypothetical protein
VSAQPSHGCHAPTWSKRPSLIAEILNFLAAQLERPSAAQSLFGPQPGDYAALEPNYENRDLDLDDAARRRR